MLPDVAWADLFVACALGDAVLGRWVLLPLFVVAFYGGMIVIDLLTYPMLSFWRGWLGRRGILAWYLVEVGGLWGTTTLAVSVLSPWWLGWHWNGALALQVLGVMLLVGSVTAGTWAVAKMGLARLLFAGALFLPGGAAEENGVPQRLVVEGPYRYVRNPLYDTDLCVILGAALLTQSWALVLVAALYLAQLALQIPLEERELGERFGAPYRRYCELVPRFVPRRSLERSEICAPESARGDSQTRSFFTAPRPLASLLPGTRRSPCPRNRVAASQSLSRGRRGHATTAVRTRWRPSSTSVIPGLCAWTNWHYDADVAKIDPTKK